MKINPKEHNIKVSNNSNDTDQPVKDTSVSEMISIAFAFISVFVFAVKLIFF